MTFEEYHNAIRVLWNIDAPAWMEPEEAKAFVYDPHSFFTRADDETARKLWALIEPRVNRKPKTEQTDMVALDSKLFMGGA